MHGYTVEVPVLWVGDGPITIGVDKIVPDTVQSVQMWSCFLYMDGDLMDASLVMTTFDKDAAYAAREYGRFAVSGMDTEDFWPLHDRVMHWADGGNARFDNTDEND